MLKLTDEQQHISDAIMEFIFCPPSSQYMAVAGYAGTGKTTVMGYTAASILKGWPDIATAYCAPTGKAASVLKRKLTEFGALNTKSMVNTVHGHIYRLLAKGQEKFIWEKKGDAKKYDIFVVDEASMVTQKMFRDLLSFKKPIIFIGDPGQLPPVGDVEFKPLIDTEYVLQTVHRQALKNPIISVATEIRNGHDIPFGKQGNTFIKVHRGEPDTTKIIHMYINKILESDTMILCGTNHTRVALNTSVRNVLGYCNTLPHVGEHLICLKNIRELGMFNGQIFTVSKSYGYCDNDSCYRIRLNNINEDIIAYTHALNSYSGTTLGQNIAEDIKDINENLKYSTQDEPYLFFFGYACSVHKSQGSEWDNVLLYDERMRYMDDSEYARWLYTGVTRAKNKLCIIK